MSRRLGEVLCERVRLAPDKLERALRVQPGSGERLGALLVQLGLVAERDVALALAEQLGLAFASAGDYPDVPLLQDEVTAEFLRQARVAPLQESADEVTVAMADPKDEYVVGALRLATGKTVVCRVGVPSEVDAALARQYGNGNALSEVVADVSNGADERNLDDIQRLRDLASEAPVIRVVNLLISRALQLRASDIHVEPFENELKVRFRVDGVLREMDAPPARSSAAVVSRIKVLASLNIAERRLPQDGRIKLRIEGREIDIRVSTVPTMHGESAVLRILDKAAVPLDFAILGFTPDILPRFENILQRPQGIVLVTGPTGSGKTTTLYAALQRLNTPERKLFTVEDPVEYQLQGINQIQVKPQIGLTFASALRSILRQDPDVIMVGEMRDLETAKIAVQSALTGHKVFSTLHTNDAASSVTRMLDMGVEDYLLASTLDCIVAQRLVRRLCEHCREPYEALPDLVRELAPSLAGRNEPPVLYRAHGCTHCDGIGYVGRTGILEMLVVSDPVRQAILRQSDAVALQKTAVEQGMGTMYADGVRKALAGVTTIEEVERVSQED